MEIVTQVQATWVKSTVRLLSKNLCHKNLCQIKLSRVFFFLVLHTERVNLENKGGKYCNIIYIHNLPALVCRWSFSFLAHQPARMLICRGSSTIPLVSNWARASQTRSPTAADVSTAIQVSLSDHSLQRVFLKNDFFWRCVSYTCETVTENTDLLYIVFNPALASFAFVPSFFMWSQNSS